MSLIALASAKGAPGVTTTCVALGLGWTKGRSVTVLEVDVAGGDLAARHSLPSEHSVAALAAAARRSLTADEIAPYVQALPGGLPVIVAGPSGQEMAAALASPAGLAAALRTLPGDVILDCGRVQAGSPVLSLLAHVDAAAVMARPLVADLAHVGETLGLMAGAGVAVGLVLRGRGPYGPRQVCDALGVPVLGQVAHDQDAAAALSGATHIPRGLRFARLLGDARGLAHQLRDLAASGDAARALESENQRVGGQR